MSTPDLIAAIQTQKYLTKQVRQEIIAVLQNPIFTLLNRDKEADKASNPADRRKYVVDQLAAVGFEIRQAAREDEFLDIVKIGILAGEIQAVAEKWDKRRGWNQWTDAMRIISKVCDTIALERMYMLEEKAMRTLANRKKHCKVNMSVDYRGRITSEETEKELIELSRERFDNIVESAIVQTCEGCHRQDWNKCECYETYTVLAVPVIDDSEDVCPYQYNMFKIPEAKELAYNNKRVG